MNPDAKREAALFQAAAQLSGLARTSFLDNACKDDAPLRQRLEALLAAHEQTEGALAEDAPRLCPEASARQAEPTMKIEFAGTSDEAVGQRIGRYKILEKVGEGGCGVVYVAEQTEPVRRRVALKVIKLGMDTKQVVARFEAERQALAMMDHPNIAKVLDAGSTEAGRPYFVMELVRGIRITDYCDQNHLSTKERLDLFIKICQAIQHAHQKGIIHRDIKPSNILVTLHDGVPVPKVIDFGIAKATEGRLTEATVYTQLHQFIGTPAYMSPEQAEMSGLDIDTRSDIYSLGVLLYELLTGCTPFDAKELASQGLDAMRKTIREQEPERPSTRVATLQGEELTTTAKRRSTDTAKLLHQLKGDLDWIAMKCLEKDRTRRYETANGLAADLKRHLDNEPVVARPPSAAYKLQKAFRRNKLAFVGATVIIGVLAIGIVVSSWQAVRARRAEQTASQQRKLAEQEAKRAEGEAKGAEAARQIADRETLLARRTAAQADARYLLQQRLLPAALGQATEAFKLGGQWEDGLLIDNIASAARQAWVLSARVPATEPVSQACVARLKKGSCVVSSAAGGLRVWDVGNGAVLGNAAVAGRVEYLFEGPGSDTVVAVGDATISMLSLPSLAVSSAKTLPSRVVFAAAKGKSLLLWLENHDVCIFDLSTLSKVASFNWDENPDTKKQQPPRHGCVSPDGRLALLHGGTYLHPVVLWDRRSDPPTITAQDIPLQEFQFVDNAHFATWQVSGSGETGVPGAIALYDVERAPAKVIFSQAVPNDDIKGHLQFQAWSSKGWNYETDFPIFGFIGPAGLGFKGISAGEWGADFAVSDRYANLLPTEAGAPEFIAADVEKGVMALRSHGELLIFQFGGHYWSGHTRDYSATVCSKGLLYISRDSPAGAQDLVFLPFDPREQPAHFQLQWISEGKWLPWAIAATPDVSTLAVIAQETDSDSRITAHYGRVRALIYNPGSLKNAPSALPIKNAFPIDAPACMPAAARFAVLDPGARALLYWNSSTTVTRYDPRNGKSLGLLELGLISARSRDGRCIAASTPAGRIRVYDSSSGATLLDIAGKPAAGLCFSADGSRVVASQAEMLTCYEAPTGRVLSSIPSSLVPLAYPSRGNRFLGFQPDATGTGGSVVLADTSDASVAAVLNRAGSGFTPAFFSDSGDQMMLAPERFKSEILRSLRPEELRAVLNTRLPDEAEIQPLPPATFADTISPTTSPVPAAVVRADDAAALQSHLGDQITIEGRVKNVTLVNSRNAANIHFTGVDERAVVVWVPWDAYPKVVAVLGEDLGAALNDRTIHATGRLTKYRETLEVTLDAPSNIQIVAPDSQPK